MLLCIFLKTKNLLAWESKLLLTVYSDIFLNAALIKYELGFQAKNLLAYLQSNCNQEQNQRNKWFPNQFP